jgi:uncharacterized protein YbcV (DUF1398 family)
MNRTPDLHRRLVIDQFTQQAAPFAQMPDGSSLVVPVSHPDMPIAREFSASGVEQAVRRAQRGEIFYPEFLKQTFAAGCVGYFVQITGQHVIYFGRNGEQHIERFPSSPK